MTLPKHHLHPLRPRKRLWNLEDPWNTPENFLKTHKLPLDPLFSSGPFERPWNSLEFIWSSFETLREALKCVWKPTDTPMTSLETPLNHNWISLRPPETPLKIPEALSNALEAPGYVWEAHWDDPGMFLKPLTLRPLKVRRNYLTLPKMHSETSLKCSWKPPEIHWKLKFSKGFLKHLWIPGIPGRITWSPRILFKPQYKVPQI